MNKNEMYSSSLILKNGEIIKNRLGPKSQIPTDEELSSFKKNIKIDKQGNIWLYYISNNYYDNGAEHIKIDFKLTEPKCECGAKSCGSSCHSDYCPLYKEK